MAASSGGTMRSSVVVPHVFSITLCDSTKSDDSDSTYESMCSFETVLRILQAARSSSSFHCSRGMRRNPHLPSASASPPAPRSRSISSVFSGPSKPSKAGSCTTAAAAAAAASAASPSTCGGCGSGGCWGGAAAPAGTRVGSPAMMACCSGACIFDSKLERGVVTAA